MSFQPVVPFSGYSGWAFLKRTESVQREAFAKSPTVERDIDYFTQNISKINSAEDLVSDHRLLSVALKAFGLESDINSKFFIRKVLDDGTLAPDALSNRLTDKRYLELSKAFGFGDFDTPNTKLSDFPNKIRAAYLEQSFEVAVGEQDENMRLSLGTERELADVLSKDLSDNGRWYTIMGNPPLRKVFETALGLPSSFGALDLDLQLKTFREKAQRVFGGAEVSQFSEPEKQEKLVRMFLVRAEINSGSIGFSPGAAALTLLRGG